MRIAKHLGIPILGFAIYISAMILCAYCIRDSIFSTLLLNVICSVGAFVYIKSIDEKEMYPRQDWGYMSLELLILIAVSFVGMWFITQLSGSWYYETFGDPSMDARATNVANSKGSEYYFILSFFLAPVWEELFLRSIVFRHLRELMGFWGAASISSIIFAAMHGTIIHMFTGFIFGMFMCMVFQITNKITIAILLHISYNVATSMGGSIVLSDFLFKTPVVIVLNIILISAMLYIFYRYKKELAEWKKNHKKEKDHIL